MGSKKAFVLAEALVVAVIVAILAAVAIPMYSGYVESQRRQVVANLAEVVAVAANAHWRRTNAPPAADGSDLNLFFPNRDKYTILIEGSLVRVSEEEDPDITADAQYR